MRNLSQSAVGLFACAISICAQPAPDFHLANVNVNSARPNATVSPRDYLFEVSGYYFGGAS
jgi:hypothetical protein